MKVSKSRKNMHSVMNHIGFGRLTVTMEGITVEVPSEWLFNDGGLKKYAQKAIKRQINAIKKERGIA